MKKSPQYLSVLMAGWPWRDVLLSENYFLSRDLAGKHWGFLGLPEHLRNCRQEVKVLGTAVSTCQIWKLYGNWSILRIRKAILITYYSMLSCEILIKTMTEANLQNIIFQLWISCFSDFWNIWNTVFLQAASFCSNFHAFAASRP